MSLFYWGLGIGDWGCGSWGLGLWGVSSGVSPKPPPPNPQSQIPNPHPQKLLKFYLLKIFINLSFI